MCTDTLSCGACMSSNPILHCYKCGKKTTNKMKTYVPSKLLYMDVSAFIHKWHFPAPHPTYGMLLDLLVSFSFLIDLHIHK